MSGRTVVLTLTDGAVGDDDLDATNGRTVDAGAPAVLAAAGEVAAVPTLSQWGTLLLSLLLASVFGRQRLLCKRGQLSKQE